ncbi:hypothetical protein AVEN_159792-1 [Araneus ventricosus]|uniref:Uncharacterized protein n=1 Tax=Araneus ventricosus TaxID=182803 RepID=A0A4Y2DBH3_ARAVE|nr:hypothetical protein AVEN_159792-1 [Araneus ventricosus]
MLDMSPMGALMLLSHRRISVCSWSMRFSTQLCRQVINKSFTDKSSTSHQQIICGQVICKQVINKSFADKSSTSHLPSHQKNQIKAIEISFLGS